MKRSKKAMALALSAVLVLVLSVSALAASGLVKDIRVQMGGIQVIVKGKPLEMKDATGATVEPIIYNGTTYLPVRAVAEAIGMEVNWDGNTNTVSLGGKTVTYLDELPATNFESTHEGISTYRSLGETEIYRDESYSRGVGIRTGIPGSDNEGVVETTTIYYTLDGSYKTFLSAVDVMRQNHAFKATVVRVYGDGELLYTSPGIVGESAAYTIEADITGVTKFSIELVTTGTDTYAGGSCDRELLFGEARLVK